jgi:hypothetical protein
VARVHEPVAGAEDMTITGDDDVPRSTSGG